MEAISPQVMAEYRATVQRREQKQRQDRMKRFIRAWDVAHTASDLLKTRFRAQKVVVFGSLLHKERFTERSDIDLAVWGVEGVEFLEAVAQLQDISEFKIDLVAELYCDKSLWKIIEEEGVAL